MNVIESIVLYITAGVSLGGLVMGFLAYNLEKENRRNSMRELIYSKQLEFCIQLNHELAAFENSLIDCMALNNIEELDNHLDKIEVNLDKLDDHYSSHEILVSESNSKIIGNYIIAGYKLLNYCRINSTLVTEKDFESISRLSSELIIDVMDSFAIEELSIDNTALGRRAEVKFARNKKK